MEILNKKAQLAGWEALIIIVLMASLGFMTYLWGTKQSETRVFKRGAVDRSLESSPHFGCTTVRYEEIMEGKLHAMVNNQANH